MQNLAVNLEGIRVERRRYGSPYDATQKSVNERLRYDDQQLKTFHESRLLTQFASGQKSIFWAAQFRIYGVEVDSSDPFQELRKLPVLSKSDVRRNCADILVPSAGRKLIRRHTSGTTGAGLVFYETRECELETWATWWRYRKSHGIKKGDLCGYFGGRSVVPVGQNTPPYWRLNHPARQLIFSNYHLSPSTASSYLEQIANVGIEWLHGYPSFISLLASYVKDAQRPLAEGVKVITFGAESLTPLHVATISQAFPKAVLAQHYGQAEAVANISQCTEGALHVDEDFSLVEFEKIEGSENRYRIIGTNLINPAFPLFRYDTGDIATLEHGSECECGSQWRVVGDIDGRIEDYVILPNGVKVGRLDHIFKDMTSVCEAQIIQRTPAEIEIKLVKAAGYSEEDEKHLEEEFRTRLGDEIALEFKYCERIERTKAGKIRFVISYLLPTEENQI